MSYLLNVKEILGFAIYIEERGYEFYIEAMKKFPDPQATRLFQYLADEEFRHEKMFKKLMVRRASLRSGEADPEYRAYMKEFVKTHQLGDREAIHAKLARLSTLNEILDMAIGFEKDSIILLLRAERDVRQGAYHRGEENRRRGDGPFAQDLRDQAQAGQEMTRRPATGDEPWS